MVWNAIAKVAQPVRTVCGRRLCLSSGGRLTFPRQHSFVSASALRRHFASDNSPSGADHHALFEQQLEELKAEREALFGFTKEDQNAWTNAAGHQHDASFMELVEQARREQDEQESKNDHAQNVSDHARSISEDHSFKEEFVRKEANNTLTHLTADGRDIKMVDIGSKVATARVAVAESKVVFPPEVLESFATHADEMIGPKGPIFATAKTAGIMAAKKTSELIPLCHPLPLDSVNLDIKLQEDGTAWIRCECRVTHKTGVEMEALTGASVAALTIYDMTKAVSHNIRIEGTRLISKSGGKRKVG